MRTLLFLIGLISLTLGVLGIFLPILPTTPFLLLAAATFLRSSDRMYNWLTNQRYLGKYIRNYQSGRGIPVKAKIYALLLLWLSLGFTIRHLLSLLLLRIVLTVIGIGVTIYLLSLPTYDSEV